MQALESLPLFPLHEVLLPGAAMDLRIFERRYLDLVRDCGRSASGFGVCLILEGDEAGAPAIPAAYGVEARIENFDLGEDGLLSLRVRGRRRFHAAATRVRDNGLLVADVAWREDLAPSPRLRPEHALLAELLRRPGAILSRAQLLDRAWGDAPESGERTVDTHVKTLRAKLRGIDPGADPIRTHRGVGYSLDAG